MEEYVQIAFQGKDEVTSILDKIAKSQQEVNRLTDGYNNAIEKNLRSVDSWRQKIEQQCSVYDSLIKKLDAVQGRLLINGVLGYDSSKLPGEKDFVPRRVLKKYNFVRGIGISNPLSNVVKETNPEDVGKELDPLASGLSKVNTDIANAGKELNSIADKFSGTVFDRQAQQFDRFTRSLNTLATSQESRAMVVIGIWTKAIGAAYRLARRYVPDLIRESDVMRSQKTRLSIFNKEKNYGGLSNDKAFALVTAMSLKTRTDVNKTADLVNKLLIANVFDEKTAVSSSIAMAGLINQALIAGGGTTEENQRALLQLTQGLASGVLQGDELRSIREQSPYLMRTLAQGIRKAYKGQAYKLGLTEEELSKVDVGNMKQLGAKGVLTSSVIVRAIEANADQIRADFERMPTTVEQSLTNVRNLWKAFALDMSPIDKPIGRFRQVFINFQNYLMSKQGLKVFNMLENALNVCAFAFEKVAGAGMWALDVIADSRMLQILAIGTSLLFLASAVKTLITAMGGLSIIKNFASLLKVLTTLDFAQSTASFLMFARHFGKHLMIMIIRLQRFILLKALAFGKAILAPLAIAAAVGLGTAYVADKFVPRSKEEEKMDLFELGWHRLFDNPNRVEKQAEKATETDIFLNQVIAMVEEGKAAGLSLGQIQENVATLLKNQSSGAKVKIDREDLEFMKSYSMHNFQLNIQTASPTMTVNTGDINNGIQLPNLLKGLNDWMIENNHMTVMGVNGIGLSNLVPATVPGKTIGLAGG